MGGPTEVTFEIKTTSSPMQDQKAPPVAPTITVNGQPFAQLKPPTVPNGWQVLVLNSAGDLTSSTSILANKWVTLYAPSGNWMSTYQYMYSRMLNIVLNAGDIQQQIVFLVSFGLDANMPPTNDALGLMLGHGAGPQLQQWETTVDVGSESGQLIGFPASYVLVGGSNSSYGQGTEAFARATGTSQAPVDLSVKLESFGAAAPAAV